MIQSDSEVTHPIEVERSWIQLKLKAVILLQHLFFTIKHVFNGVLKLHKKQFKLNSRILLVIVV